MTSSAVYDLAGIGIGPFNLGMAALAATVPQLKTVFFETKPAFSWHPGMLLDFSTLQVPFYADLVTGADPSNPYSFLTYLKRTGKLYQFAVLEENYISRKAYNDYCCWVAAQLPGLYFNHTVSTVSYDEQHGLYEMEVMHKGMPLLFRARTLVVGIGSVPSYPACIGPVLPPYHIHSADYLPSKKHILEADTVTIIGSGQSAAEIFYDLMSASGACYQQLKWITRASRFHPMETAKLTLEMTSPDYIRYFYHLPPEQKSRVLAAQHFLYKGINQELIAAIYRQLYQQAESQCRFLLVTGCALTRVETAAEHSRLHFFHQDTQRSFSCKSRAVILATGYQPATAPFLQPIVDRLCYDADGRYQVRANYAIDKEGREVFVQNAELHSHGFNTPDLGMGPYRNAVILNSLLGYPHFDLEERVAFQWFGPLAEDREEPSVTGSGPVVERDGP